MVENVILIMLSIGANECKITIMKADGEISIYAAGVDVYSGESLTPAILSNGVNFEVFWLPTRQVLIRGAN